MMAFSGKLHFVIMLDVMKVATVSGMRRPKPYRYVPTMQENFNIVLIDSLWLRFYGAETRRLFCPLPVYWRHQPVTVTAIKWYVTMTQLWIMIINLFTGSLIYSWKYFSEHHVTKNSAYRVQFFKFNGHSSRISPLFPVYADCLTPLIAYSFEIFFS